MVKVLRFAMFLLRMEVECLHHQKVKFSPFFFYAGGGMACPRVWFFLGFDRSATKVWHKFTYEEHISV